MLFGQMSIPKLSLKADYLQLDICGLTTKEVIEKYNKYNNRIPVILHGDWTKKGFSENKLLEKQRQNEYIDIINNMRNETEVIGITIHPPYRSKTSFENFLGIIDYIEKETNIQVFIENRSNKSIWLSNVNEIVQLSYERKMTIDIPQLYISCGYNEKTLLETLKLLNKENIKEIHFANIHRVENHSYVARKIDDGVLDLSKVIREIEETKYFTLEILGGINTFEQEIEKIKKL